MAPLGLQPLALHPLSPYPDALCLTYVGEIPFAYSRDQAFFFCLHVTFSGKPSSISQPTTNSSKCFPCKKAILTAAV